MKAIKNLTPAELNSLRAQFEIVMNRVNLRRVIGDCVGFTTHQFKYRTSNAMILLTVDNCTSGRWGYSIRDDWVAFEDEGDMTMFMLAYIEPVFKPARFV